jgi:hypothetical protein
VHKAERSRTPYVATLRIYEPLGAFSQAEQLRWGSLASSEETKFEESERAIKRTIITATPVATADGAHCIEQDGIKYISPWSTATRVWGALNSFKDELPLPIAHFFIPENEEEAITSHSELLEDKVPYAITETWMVPPRWFSLFEPHEVIRGHDEYGAYVYHRTKISNAKERCMFTHKAVVGAFGEGPIEAEIADLLEWLSLFHEQSLVELDYGGLASYLERILLDNGEEGLEADTSVQDIMNSLAGLAVGDGAAAGQGYERLVSRWRKVSAIEQAM